MPLERTRHVTAGAFDARNSSYVLSATFECLISYAR